MRKDSFQIYQLHILMLTLSWFFMQLKTFPCNNFINNILIDKYDTSKSVDKNFLHSFKKIEIYIPDIFESFLSIYWKNLNDFISNIVKHDKIFIYYTQKLVKHIWASKK